MSFQFLWYIPNQNTAGHRGEPVTADHNSLATLTAQARALEEHGWKGALVGAGWGRPDTFTVATALAAGTTTFEPLIATRPGYWHPANFAKSAATLDQLTGGRVRVNVVSGQDNLAAYGDSEGDQASRYARTKEFMRLLRRLWTEQDVTYAGEYYHVTGSTVVPPVEPRPGRAHPPLYFGGASAAAEAVSATEADIQLFWGEPLDGVAERIERLRRLSGELGREHPPLQFGLRVTTVVRDSTEQAWADAEAKVAEMARAQNRFPRDAKWHARDRPAAPGPAGRAGRGAGRQPLHRPGPVRRRGCRHDLAGRLGRGRSQFAAEVRRPRHHPLRAVRHALPARARAAGRPAAAVAAVGGGRRGILAVAFVYLDTALPRSSGFAEPGQHPGGRPQREAATPAPVRRCVIGRLHNAVCRP